MELVERDVPLQELTTIRQQAAAGEGCLVFVYGEAGVGKTALLEAFASRQEDGVRLLWGACDALFTPRPLGPLHDIAAQTGGELARSLREEGQRTALFSAFLQQLSGKAGPVTHRLATIAMIEDVHWADEATLDLLKYVGRRIQRLPALLLVTFRDDELGPQHPLRLLLGDLATSPAVRRIGLTPLTERGVSRLVGGQPIDATALHRQTGGNPFYVTEVLATGESGVPPTVRDAVLARAARLSLSARAVLNAAAVAGPRIEPWLLADVVRAEARAVDESLDVGILRAQGPALAFRHELARQAILDAIAPHQRLFLHQAVLDVLKASARTQNDVSRLAHHAAAAEDGEAILTYVPAAAEAAYSTGALREAARLWKLALRYSSGLPAQRQASFYASFAAASHENPDRSEALEAYEKAVALATESRDHYLAGSALCRMAVVLLMEGRMSDSVRAAEAALAMLEPLGASPQLAAAHKTRAFQHLTLGENEQAVSRARSCLTVAAILESGPLHVEAYHALGLCTLPLDHAEGRRYLEQSLALLLQEKMYWGAGSVYSDLAMTCVDVYLLERAEALLAAGLQITTEQDMDLSRLVLQAWQAIVLTYRGRWEEAMALASAVVARPERMEVYRVAALVALGRLRARRGEQGVWQALDEARERSRRVNNVQRLGVVAIARAEAAWLEGNIEKALAEAHAVYDLAITNKQPGFAAELAYWRWRCGQPVETFDWMVRPFVLEIEGRWRAAAEAWRDLGCPYEEARALAQGDAETQKEALVIFEQLGAQPMAERTRHSLRQLGVQTIPRGPHATTRENPFGLTNRQLQVLGLLVEGLTNTEIAARLHISPKTVDHHVSAVLAQLNVPSREEAAAIARQNPGIA